MKSFRTEEYKNSPLYQNNPGNLPNKGEDWGGKVLKAQRKGNAKYEEFMTVEYGLRALMINIRTIMDKGGKNTIADFARRFYPAASTNKYLLYEKTLTKAFGIDNHKRITAFTKDFYIKMAKIVASIEMGAAESLIPADAYDTAYVYMGINMTSGGNPVLPAPAKPIIPLPAKPNTPAPTKPSTPAPTKPSTPAPTKPSTPAPTKPSTPAPTKPSTPAPTKPSNPAPNNGGNTNTGGGNTNTGGGTSNLNQGGYTPAPAPAPSGNGNATNWLLWGGLAVALGTGGYLIYSYYAKPKGKKK
nr:MAG TPA: virion protein [Caudoviricetes sp.]